MAELKRSPEELKKIEAAHKVNDTGKDKFAAPPTDFFNIKMKDIDGKEVDFNQYKGKFKAILCVNVATLCDLTNIDYPQLVELHKKFQKEGKIYQFSENQIGFEILGFPCNQFADQETFSEKDIKAMVTNQYQVEFPLFSKVIVNGKETCPLYQYLRNNSQLKDQKTGEVHYIQWNFGKFLLDKNCQVVKYYEPSVVPSNIEKDIVNQLK